MIWMSHGRRFSIFLSPATWGYSKFFRLRLISRAALSLILFLVAMSFSREAPVFADTQGFTKSSHPELQASGDLKVTPSADPTIGPPDQGEKADKVEDPSSGTVSVIHKRIEKSLHHTLSDLGFSEDLLTEVTHVLDGRIDSRRIGKEDRITIALDGEMQDATPSDAVAVRAVRLNHQGKNFFAFHFPHDEKGGFYDESGRSLEVLFLRSPVVSGRVTSPFSKARLHPVSGKPLRHPGIDYAAPNGTPIMSIADGVVEEVRSHRTMGRFVRISHSDGYETEYLHMSRFEPGIKQGVSVGRGQTIGYVGRTGTATGPHVELRLKKSGRYIDLSKERIIQASSLPAPFLDCFRQRVELFKGYLENGAGQDKVDFVFHCALGKEPGPL